MFSFMMQTVWLLFTTDETFTPPFIREQQMRNAEQRETDQESNGNKADDPVISVGDI